MVGAPGEVGDLVHEADRPGEVLEEVGPLDGAAGPPTRGSLQAFLDLRRLVCTRILSGDTRSSAHGSRRAVGTGIFGHGPERGPTHTPRTGTPAPRDASGALRRGAALGQRENFPGELGDGPPRRLADRAAIEDLDARVREARRRRARIGTLRWLGVDWDEARWSSPTTCRPSWTRCARSRARAGPTRAR